MKYTILELIELLKLFPEELTIETDLAFMWNYPEHLKQKKDSLTEEGFAELTMMNATNLCIFEGDWNKRVSDLEGRLND